jgi:hypothetical protein
VKTRTRVLIGAVAFVIVALWRVPDLRHEAWGEVLIGFAALVLVPLLLDLLDDSKDDPLTVKLLGTARRWQFPAALTLLVTGVLPPGYLAALGAVPWAGVLILLGLVGLRRIARGGVRPLGLRCREIGLLYGVVAVFWLLADRLALRPLGFDATIVRLTAVHFHYAGVILPVLTGLALSTCNAKGRARFIGVGVIVGVPAVAVGITSAQLRFSPLIEMAATLVMAAGGMGAAWLHLKLAAEKRWPLVVRSLWGAAALSLAVGMTLAALYGVRGVFHPLPWLDIPWMRALHGSLNALGFGCCGVAGWWRARALRGTIDA